MFAGSTYPFTAIVGQDLLKRALLLNAICPRLGGVLIAGERGTAKSTAARALAALLPPLAVTPGCPYRCEPSSNADCPHCMGARSAGEADHPAPFVELPLGATEDRVAGSLDIERTLREGRPAFRPGLLAAAHRGVLYIDEVNLLADHLADLLLDAAASGVHTVEREGIAVRHPAEFILIGTMNPDEGELRPQLADRFGLKVHVTSPADAASRAEIVRRRLAFDADPAAFCTLWHDQELQLAQQICAARSAYSCVLLSDEQLERIAAICAEHQVEGLRADIALSRSARALAALAGRAEVAAKDLQEAAELVLPHRQRGTCRPEQPALPNLFHDDAAESNEKNGAAGEIAVTPDETQAPPRLTAPANDHEARRGRRNPLPGAARGRHVRSLPGQAGGDIALDATLRAAALRGGSLAVRSEDLQRKVREDRQGTLVIFVVDCSGSMGARRRMEAVKGIVLGMLADANRQRDEVAVIAVRGARSELLLPPTRDVAIAEKALARLPTGGRTPLAHGIDLACDLANQTRRPVLLILVSDGKANVSLPGTRNDPWAQALEVCPIFKGPGRKAVLIDAEEETAGSGRIRELARALSAVCLPLAELSEQTTRYEDYS